MPWAPGLQMGLLNTVDCLALRGQTNSWSQRATQVPLTATAPEPPTFSYKTWVHFTPKGIGSSTKMSFRKRPCSPLKHFSLHYFDLHFDHIALSSSTLPLLPGRLTNGTVQRWFDTDGSMWRLFRRSPRLSRYGAYAGWQRIIHGFHLARWWTAPDVMYQLFAMSRRLRVMETLLMMIGHF
jgi:hypothetical protein